MQAENLYMSACDEASTYPRQLRFKERDALESILPSDHPGYRDYHEFIAKMAVIGEGRRGAGNFVLGWGNDTPDNVSPLAPVMAYGVIETVTDTFYITLREYIGNQIDCEIISSQGQEIPDHYEEKRRWTYSTWTPGEPSPSTGERMREVRISSMFTFAIASKENRMLLHDHESGINHIIPITSYYNELMLHKRVRDPKIALHSDYFFANLSSFNDDDLRAAFIAYNKLKHRVSLIGPRSAERIGGSLLRKLFGK